MKIILHMGLPKTGTTSLQNALFASRDKLRKRDVVYPDGGAARENHKLLTVLCHPPEMVVQNIRFLFDHDDARMRRAAVAMWDATKKEVERARPKLLILSSEHLSSNVSPESLQKLRDLLTPLSSDVAPVVYFREAAAHFGSNAQQRVKNGRPIEPIDGTSLQREVSMIEEAFGAPITACVADRDQLIDGDIVTDFLARFVAPVVGEIEIAPVRLNESISAEVLAIMERFRKLRYPNHVGPMPDHFSLRTILSRLERDSGRTGNPRLRPEVAAAVRRASLDTLWLRDRYGVTFKGVDYAVIDGAPFDVDPAHVTIEDLFEVDPDRREALYAAALAEALGSWRQLGRMPRLFVGAGGGGLFGRLRRGAA